MFRPHALPPIHAASGQKRTSPDDARPSSILARLRCPRRCLIRWYGFGSSARKMGQLPSPSNPLGTPGSGRERLASKGSQPLHVRRERLGSGRRLRARLGACADRRRDRVVYSGSIAGLVSPTGSHIAHARGRELLSGPVDLFPHHAIVCMVVDQSHGLDEGVHGGRADELPASPLQVF